MPKIRAVLFDLDGTIRDSRAAINPAVMHALEKHGVRGFDGAAVNAHIHSLRAVHAEMADHVEYETFRDSYDEKLSELLGEIFIYEGAVEALSELKESGYKVALVSSSRFAHEAVKADGIDHLFDAVVGGHDVTKHKPDPEPIRLALKQVNERAKSVVMVGDLAADILAGKAAGVAVTIGMTHGFGTRGMLLEAGADHILDSLEHLPNVIKGIG